MLSKQQWNKSQKRGAKRTAFSLVELMVVLVIIGLLAGVATISVSKMMNVGRTETAKTNIIKIADAIDSYFTLHGAYPTEDEGLAILIDGKEGDGDGLLRNLPQDPWNRDFIYIQPGQDDPYEIISYGADGIEGGTGENADIISSEILRGESE